MYAAPVLATALLGALMMGAPPALGHNVVEDSTPTPGSTVTQSPITVSITTNDVFLDLGGDAQGFGIVVRDGAGLYYGDGCVTLVERTMSANVDLGGPGTYEVIYQFVSADGHSLSESYEFTFAPESNHTPAQGSDSPAECGVERSAADEQPEPLTVATPATTEELPAQEDPPRDPILIVGFLSIVTIAVVVWIVWRVRQKRNGD